jgi:polyhydroxybutyrate depolymerase
MFAAALCAFAACGGDDSTAPDAAAAAVDAPPGAADAPPGTPDAAPNTPDAAPDTTDPLITARPYQFHVPASYDPSSPTPTPLVVVLHGYTFTGQIQVDYFKMIAASDAHGFLLAYPDGTTNLSGFHFWNATDACCNIDHSSVDDVAYLTAVIDDMAKRYHVDAKRVYLVGHSNGGFMAHRMACDRSHKIAAIVSLAGAQWNDPSKCQSAEAVAVMEMHGDADELIYYGGGLDTGGAAYPSAATTVATWAAKNGCTGGIADDGTKDLVSDLAGAETTTASYAGCPAGGAVTLWTIHGGHHIPSLQTTWADDVWAFLASHPKP